LIQNKEDKIVKKMFQMFLYIFIGFTILSLDCLSAKKDSKKAGAEIVERHDITKLIGINSIGKQKKMDKKNNNFYIVLCPNIYVIDADFKLVEQKTINEINTFSNSDTTGICIRDKHIYIQVNEIFLDKNRVNRSKKYIMKFNDDFTLNKFINFENSSDMIYFSDLDYFENTNSFLSFTYHFYSFEEYIDGISSSVKKLENFDSDKNFYFSKFSYNDVSYDIYGNSEYFAIDFDDNILLSSYTIRNNSEVNYVVSIEYLDSKKNSIIILNYLNIYYPVHDILWDNGFVWVLIDYGYSSTELIKLKPL